MNKITNIEKIKNILEQNNGILLTRELTKNGIARTFLKGLESSGYIEKVDRGVYVKKGKTINEFFLMQERYKTGIFSHNTALYFYGLTDRTPLKLDMTFTNNIRLKNELLNVHYIIKDKYDLGIEKITLKDGTVLRVYDIERTICDIIRDKNKLDIQILNTAIKEYMKRSDKNLIKLYKYAKVFNITKKIEEYMEVL